MESRKGFLLFLKKKKQKDFFPFAVFAGGKMIFDRNHFVVLLCGEERILNDRGIAS
jgi:hypothetical protein